MTAPPPQPPDATQAWFQQLSVDVLVEAKKKVDAMEPGCRRLLEAYHGIAWAWSQLEEAILEFDGSRDAARDTLQWISRNEPGREEISFDLLVESLGRDPDQAYKTFTRDVPRWALRMAMGGINWQCPLCGEVK